MCVAASQIKVTSAGVNVRDAFAVVPSSAVIATVTVVARPAGPKVSVIESAPISDVCTVLLTRQVTRDDSIGKENVSAVRVIVCPGCGAFEELFIERGIAICAVA